MKIQLVPAILAYNVNDFKEKLSFFEKYFNLIQIDFADGKLVKNKNFYNLDKIKKIRTKANYELHLMVANPKKVIKEWINYKNVKRIIIHYESFQKNKIKIYELIEDIKNKKIEIGIAFNPSTTVSKILEFLHDIDLILVMGVNPGKSGQEFDESSIDKIKIIRKHYPKLNIAVDGGIDEKNVKRILKAGANVIDSASMLLNYQDNSKGLKTLIKKIKS